MTATVASTPTLGQTWGLTPNSKGSASRRARALTPGRSPAMRTSSRREDGDGCNRTSRFAASGLHWRRVEATDPELRDNAQEWCAARTEIWNELLAAALLGKPNSVLTAEKLCALVDRAQNILLDHAAEGQTGRASESEDRGNDGEGADMGTVGSGHRGTGGSSGNADSRYGALPCKWVTFTREEWDSFGVEATLGSGSLSYMVYVRAGGTYFTPAEANALPRDGGFLHGQATPTPLSSSRRPTPLSSSRRAVQFLARLRARTGRQQTAGLNEDDGPRHGPQSVYAVGGYAAEDREARSVAICKEDGCGGASRIGSGSDGVRHGGDCDDLHDDKSGATNRRGDGAALHGGDNRTKCDRPDLDIGVGARDSGHGGGHGARSGHGVDIDHSGGSCYGNGGVGHGIGCGRTADLDNGSGARNGDGSGGRIGRYAKDSGSITQFLGSPVRWTRAAATRPHKGEASAPRAPPGRQGLPGGQAPVLEGKKDSHSARQRPAPLQLSSQQRDVAPPLKPVSPRSSLFSKLSLRSPNKSALRLDTAPAEISSDCMSAVPSSLLGEIAKTRIHSGRFFRAARPHPQAQRLPPIAVANIVHASRAEVPVGWSDFRGV